MNILEMLLLSLLVDWLVQLFLNWDDIRALVSSCLIALDRVCPIRIWRIFTPYCS